MPGKKPGERGGEANQAENSNDVRMLDSLVHEARQIWSVEPAADLIRILKMVFETLLVGEDCDGDKRRSRVGAVEDRFVCTLACTFECIFEANNGSREDLDQAMNLWLKVCLTTVEEYPDVAIALGSKLLGSGGSFFSSFQAKKSLPPSSNTRRRLVLETKSDPDTAMLQMELLDTLLKHSDNFKIFCADFEQLPFKYRVLIEYAAKHAEASPPTFHGMVEMLVRHSSRLAKIIIEHDENPVTASIRLWCIDCGKGPSVLSAFQNAVISVRSGCCAYESLEDLWLKQCGVAASRHQLSTVTIGTKIWDISVPSVIQTRTCLSFTRLHDEEVLIVNLSSLSLLADEWKMGELIVPCNIRPPLPVWATSSNRVIFEFKTPNGASQFVQTIRSRKGSLVTQRRDRRFEVMEGIVETGDEDDGKEGLVQEEDDYAQPINFGDKEMLMNATVKKSSLQGWWAVGEDQLRVECRERELRDSGEKKDLISRISEHDIALLKMLEEEQQHSDEEKELLDKVQIRDKELLQMLEEEQQLSDEERELHQQKSQGPVFSDVCQPTASPLQVLGNNGDKGINDYGYWERDVDGNRRWVETRQCGTPAIGKHASKHRKAQVQALAVTHGKLQGRRAQRGLETSFFAKDMQHHVDDDSTAIVSTFAENEVSCEGEPVQTRWLNDFVYPQDNGNHESNQRSGVLSSSAVTKGNRMEGSLGSGKDICERSQPSSQNLNSSSSSQPFEDETKEKPIISTAKFSSAVQTANSPEREGTACQNSLDDSLSGKETADNSLDKDPISISPSSPKIKPMGIAEETFFASFSPSISSSLSSPAGGWEYPDSAEDEFDYLLLPPRDLVSYPTRPKFVSAFSSNQYSRHLDTFSSSSSSRSLAKLERLLPHIRAPRNVAIHLKGCIHRIAQRKRAEVGEMARASTAALDKAIDKITTKFTVEVAEVNRRSTIELNKLAEERKKTIEEHRRCYDVYKRRMAEIYKQGKSLLSAAVRLQAEGTSRRAKHAAEIRQRVSRSKSACSNEVKALRGQHDTAPSPADTKEIHKIIQELFSPS